MNDENYRAYLEEGLSASDRSSDLGNFWRDVAVRIHRIEREAREKREREDEKEYRSYLRLKRKYGGVEQPHIEEFDTGLEFIEARRRHAHESALRIEAEKKRKENG